MTENSEKQFIVFLMEIKKFQKSFNQLSLKILI